MKSKNVFYWLTTILLSAFMLYTAGSYLRHEPKISAAMEELGYPGYFQNILGVAKLLGAIVLLLPGLPRLKEWAYAGFTFTFLGAICSHLACGQTTAALMPAFTLLLLVGSYILRPASRRVVVIPTVPVIG